MAIANPDNGWVVTSCRYYHQLDGVQGEEMPTFFLRCIKGLKRHGAVHILLRKDIDVEDKTSQFKNHWRYQDYTKQHQITPEEWKIIFKAIRSAKPM